MRGGGVPGVCVLSVGARKGCDVRYLPDTRELELERTDCRACDMPREGVLQGQAPVFAFVQCPKCHGTGKRGSGRCRECNDRDGYYPRGRRPGSVVDYRTVASTVPCGSCGGDYAGADSETFCDHAPDSVVSGLPLLVVRQDRGSSWNEEYLGHGCLWSSVDYGAAWSTSDEDVLARVRESLYGVQAVKMVSKYGREDLRARVCDYLAVIVTRNGYSVRAAFAGDSTVGDAFLELRGNDALAVGMAVYAAGGHGTMAAATGRYPTT